jgi:hypothetical protein
MIDDDYLSWIVKEARPMAFEQRIPEIMAPLMEEAGLAPLKPSIIIFSSLLWDESFLWMVSSFLLLLLGFILPSSASPPYSSSSFSAYLQHLHYGS